MRLSFFRRGYLYWGAHDIDGENMTGENNEMVTVVLAAPNICPQCGGVDTMWPVWRRSSHKCEVCGGQWRDRTLDKMAGESPRAKAGVLTVVA